jgi:hypothetical protein
LTSLRESFSLLSDTLATFQNKISLFLLIDVAHLAVNAVAFSGLMILIGGKSAVATEHMIMFADTLIRIVMVTFSCGHITEEVFDLS